MFVIMYLQWKEISQWLHLGATESILYFSAPIEK